MKVLQRFRDKYDNKVIYNVGDNFFSYDEERIKDLVERGLIEGKMPSIEPIEEPKPRKKKKGD